MVCFPLCIVLFYQVAEIKFLCLLCIGKEAERFFNQQLSSNTLGSEEACGHDLDIHGTVQGQSPEVRMPLLAHAPGGPDQPENTSLQSIVSQGTQSATPPLRFDVIKFHLNCHSLQSPCLMLTPLDHTLQFLCSL